MSSELIKHLSGHQIKSELVVERAAQQGERQVFPGTLEPVHGPSSNSERKADKECLKFPAMFIRTAQKPNSFQIHGNSKNTTFINTECPKKKGKRLLNTNKQAEKWV